MRAMARRLAKRAAAAALGLALALLAFELALRVYAHATHRERGLDFDPYLGWRPRPGLEKVGEHWSVARPARTNADGFRDAEFAPSKAPGTTRVVALGDSFTFGAEVDDGERWTEALERLDPAVEVLNLGVNAYGTDQEVTLYERRGARYAPDVVVLALFTGNDLEDVRYRRRFHWPRPYYVLAGATPTLRPARASLDVRLRTSSYVGELLYGALERWIPAQELAPEWREGDTLPLVRALLARLAERCADGGARCLVLLVHPRERAPYPEDERERRVREALEELGIALLDTRALFPRDAVARGLYAPGGHWSPAGHALVASALHARLAGLGWLAAPPAPVERAARGG
jgi:lysophospholipase L1-like esterase